MKKAYFGILLGWITSSFIFLSCEKVDVPVVKTTQVTNIKSDSATCGGQVIFDNGSIITGRGVCWNTSTNPTIDDNKTSDGEGEGDFTSHLSGLNGGTNYYVRAYAINKAGVGYGDEVTFTTLGQSPVATIEAPFDITTTTATLIGNVNPNYLTTAITFEYGTTKSYENTVTAIQSPLNDNTSPRVTAQISGLSEGTEYYCRIKAINSLGTGYSDDIMFRTLGDKPTVSIQSVQRLKTTSAMLNGLINANHLNTQVIFEYGTSANYGNSVSFSHNPITGNTNTKVSVIIDNLISGTIYHCRIVAENNLGTTLSSDLTFSTLSPLVDIDGNRYDVVEIGTQTWMAENLRTTKYNNGDDIGTTYPYNKDIRGENEPTYQWAFDGNDTDVDPYGRLYTWYVAADSRNVCPSGWHVPTDGDWDILIKYLGGINFAGGKMKDIGSDSWSSPNTGGDNSSGFSALGSGNRWPEGSFHYRGSYCIMWSSTPKTTTLVRPLELAFDSNEIILIRYPKIDGFSIRCIAN